MKSFTNEKHENILGYQNVRDAARDYETYSSDLQGDRDVRDYRQLPLEVDPPVHTNYRHAIQPLFLRPRLEEHANRFEKLAEGLLEGCIGRGKDFDVYRELAMPFVVGCLSIIYNRPQDLDTWLSWGHDVWTAKSETRSGEILHAYLDSVWEQDSKDDIWHFIKQVQPNGAELERHEFFGYASVLLAGGRDTVIKLITGIVWHLLNAPEDAKAIVEDDTLARTLVNELLRFLSPLPAIERVKKEDFSTEEPLYQRLHFASANHDPEVWEKPGVVSLERGKQPHLAFGYGPHACIGMNLAEYEAKAFLKALLPRLESLELVSSNLVWERVEEFEFLRELSDVRVKILGS